MIKRVAKLDIGKIIKAEILPIRAVQDPFGSWAPQVDIGSGLWYTYVKFIAFAIMSRTSTSSPS